jgi:hypothetical protein
MRHLQAFLPLEERQKAKEMGTRIVGSEFPSLRTSIFPLARLPCKRIEIPCYVEQGIL